ncbi:gelsolin, cytoplasmic-like [Sycon ciliatum]|uniref:gelsolin, cytoplasmic-like n=1 Tax=Sycon ciliatum TaxID=27933 RepID=UPI0020AE8300|eukprot:scpid6885/ scgid4413/ Villin-1
MADAAFKGVGQKPGLQIWRIEDMKVVQWPQDRYGDFHTGDSYIILNTKKRSTALEWDIHFWLGKETSQDEKGVAAYKTVELDDSLGGGPVQYREVQHHESNTFLKLFKKGVSYLEGGIKSGFKAVDREAFGKRMLHVKGRRNIRVQQVAFEAKSLNQGDVFIVDLGRKIWVWNGSEASRLEKMKGLETALKIRDEERHGKAIIHVTEEADDNADFFKDLGTKESKIAPASAAADDAAFERKNASSVKLFKVSDASGSLKVEEVGSKPLKYAMLDTNDCFILDTGASGVHAWIGKKATADEKKNAMKIATGFLAEKGYPDWTPVTRTVEGAETPMFKNSFSDWPERKQTGTYSKSRGVAAGPKTPAKVDAKSMHQRAEAEKPRQPDDGQGKVQVWRIEDFKMVPQEQHLYGQFFGGDSYVIQYTYEVNGVEHFYIYFWQGLTSSQDERGASALHAKELDDSLGGRPVQVRVVQGKEPQHFYSIFKGRMVIHEGGKASGFKNIADTDSYDTDGTRLFHVKGTSEVNTRAVQVEEKASSLNSNDAFVLETPTATYIWCGKGCSGDERELAKHVAQGVSKREHILTLEGKESDEFWAGLGGKTAYADNPRLFDEVQQAPPRLFQCSNATGGFRVEEIPEFTQEDLIEDDVMILDTFDQVFVWIGKNANAVEKEMSLKTAVEYIKSDPAQRDLDSTNLLQVKQGYEPITFTCHFFGWDPKKWESARSLESMMDNLNVGVTLVSDELSKYEKKHSFDVLKSSCPEGVDIVNKEYYLEDSEFEKVFGMSLSEYDKLPQWKRSNLKKKCGLF